MIAAFALYPSAVAQLLWQAACHVARTALQLMPEEG